MRLRARDVGPVRQGVLHPGRRRGGQGRDRGPHQGGPRRESAGGVRRGAAGESRARRGGVAVRSSGELLDCVVGVQDVSSGGPVFGVMAATIRTSCWRRRRRPEYAHRRRPRRGPRRTIGSAAGSAWAQAANGVADVQTDRPSPAAVDVWVLGSTTADGSPPPALVQALAGRGLGRRPVSAGPTN